MSYCGPGRITRVYIARSCTRKSRQEHVARYRIVKGREGPWGAGARPWKSGTFARDQQQSLGVGQPFEGTYNICRKTTQGRPPATTGVVWGSGYGAYVCAVRARWSRMESRASTPSDWIPRHGVVPGLRSVTLYAKATCLMCSWWAGGGRLAPEGADGVRSAREPNLIMTVRRF